MNEEQIEKLIDDANLSSTASFRIREWFVQNIQEPVVVGLSDSQMTDISNYLWKNMSIFTPQHCNNLLIHWAKTQTFAQSEPFQPNWNDVPKGTEFVRIIAEYADKNHRAISASEILAQYVLQDPPHPAPRVEVGQVWRYVSEGKSGDDYTINTLTRMKIGEDWVDAVSYFQMLGDTIYTRTLSDFLEKFKQVQS
jgi:hypothetical protein